MDKRFIAIVLIVFSALYINKAVGWYQEYQLEIKDKIKRGEE